MYMTFLYLYLCICVSGVNVVIAAGATIGWPPSPNGNMLTESISSQDCKSVIEPKILKVLPLFVLVIYDEILALDIKNKGERISGEKSVDK